MGQMMLSRRRTPAEGGVVDENWLCIEINQLRGIIHGLAELRGGYAHSDFVLTLARRNPNAGGQAKPADNRQGLA
jgi:hypothetical protein